MSTPESIYADRLRHPRDLVLSIIGKRPQNQPYLSIREAGFDGEVLATVDNANSLCALAYRILRALGDEP